MISPVLPDAMNFVRERFNVIKLSQEQLNIRFGSFLDAATRKVAEMWTEVSGKKLDSQELYELNDTLDSFFEDKRNEVI